MTPSAREPVSFITPEEGDDRELAKGTVLDGPHVIIETTVRTYRVDVAAVGPEEIAEARKVLRQMHRAGGFSLDIR